MFFFPLSRSFSKSLYSGNYLSPPHHRFPIWSRLREAEPHDTETQPPDPAQPCRSARTRGEPTWPNSHSDGSSARPTWPDTSSDMSASDRPSCTSSLPTCTTWSSAEPSQPTFWPPPTALPTRRQVKPRRVILGDLMLFYGFYILEESPLIPLYEEGDI